MYMLIIANSNTCNMHIIIIHVPCTCRSQMLPDDEKVSEEELSKLADDIELKLYNVHNQVRLIC